LPARTVRQRVSRHELLPDLVRRAGRLALERGLIAPDEIEAGKPLHPARPVARKLTPDGVAAMLHRGGPTERESKTPARFAPGYRIRTRMIHPPTHTRLPGYVRGMSASSSGFLGCHVFPDSNATGAGENPQWLYTVIFDAASCGAEASDPDLKISVDAWQPYLEPA